MNIRTGPAVRGAARAVVAAVFACTLPFAPAVANVVKCTDVDGNITYQDTPCERGQAGRAVALPPPAEVRDDAGAWDAAAKQARVIKGMPKRWVLRARGAPAEIRPASTREGASEVWRYAGREGVTLVGFAGPDVAWVREDVGGKDAEPRVSKAAPEADARGAQNRRFVIAGRYCEHVFAEIGPPDRQEALDAGPPAARNTRNYYEPGPGDPQMRTVFNCLAGKVIDVERTVVR
jgi:hypothetical protein